MLVGLVAQRANDRAVAVADELRSTLDTAVWMDKETAARLAATPGDTVSVEGRSLAAMSDCDLLVSIGGDGTFLLTARAAGTTPVMGVNLGEVGFLNAISPDEAAETVARTTERLRAGDASYQELPRVVATGADWRLGPAVNEVVIMGRRRGSGQGVGLQIRVDGALYTGGHADGVLVATPTGSTAYNLSHGGPLVHPDVDALLVTTMYETDAMPPLAVPGERTVTVTVEDPSTAVAVADGRKREELAPPTQVTIRRAETPLRIAGPPLSFFTALGKLK